MKATRIVVIILITIWVILCLIWILRLILPRQVDDIGPEIFCENGIIEKSETLWVIPLYNNRSIAENKTWCENILSLNKTLGMHGVYHTYNEFYEIQTESYIEKGMEEFKKCFGYYPIIFKSPQLSLNRKNTDVLKSMNLTIYGMFNQISHKAYHCNYEKEFSMKLWGFIHVSNKMVDII